jgi:hypothetical protein
MRVIRVHITQDDYGYWMMSYESEDRGLALASFAGETVGHLLHHAYHPQDLGLPPDTEFLISHTTIPLRMGDPGWRIPSPRRVSEPHYVVRQGRRFYVARARAAAAGPTWVYFQSDGSRGTAAANTHTCAKCMSDSQGDPSIFVYGGDVYDCGSSCDYEEFAHVYGDVLPQLAAIPGNHDWMTPPSLGYDAFWQHHTPSLTQIDTAQTGPDSHHYQVDLGNSWLGILVDCGVGATQALTPFGLNRIDTWIRDHGARNIILFLHFARLSCGLHGDNPAIHCLWTKCFNPDSTPRVAAWVGGHNHNMSIYSQRGPDPLKTASPSTGIWIFNNGGGGAPLYELSGGSSPNCSAKTYGFLRIKLSDANTAEFQNFSTGDDGLDSASAVGCKSVIGV